MHQLTSQHIIALQISHTELFPFVCFMNHVGQYKEKAAFF